MADRNRWRPLGTSLVLLGILSRLLPHPPNMTSVGAAGLFSGARLRRWQAFLIPLITMAVTDPIVGFIYGFHPFSWLTPVIYVSLLINVWIGVCLRATESPLRISAAALVGSVQFSLLTNFAVWLIGDGRLYPHTATGLAACYIAGLPFLGWTALGDLAYSGVLFSIHGWLARRAFHGERIAQPVAAP
jgi:hypothetical protein